ncbi:MAG TPA: hypothetical protein VFD64_13280 [Gemmatimonadaceae bacterium]|nr:hypothetical protein [Gemmatimonadaceae bacterium]
MSRIHALLFAGVAVTACDAPTDTLPLTNAITAPGTVVVTVDRATYTWEEAQTQGIRGKIKNTGSSPVYSSIGDAFNSSLEQDPLLIAYGSDGAIERKNGENVWAAVETAVAIEGTRFVLLRPGQEYHFIAHVAGASRPGTYRVSVTYRSRINDEERATIGVDYSAGFDIR